MRAHGEVITGASRRPRILLGLALSGLAVLASCSSDDEPHAASTTTEQPTGFIGGCEPFRVYAQKRWEPLGAAIREEPNVLAAKVASGGPNEILAADGWIHSGEATYPGNPAPFNNDVWYHLANADEWVSFAGVRGDVTTPDPTSIDGGKPAPLLPACEGVYKP